MLGKLIKHEFKATARLFIPIFILVTAITVAVRFLADILYDFNEQGTKSGEIFSMIIAFIFGAALVIGIICLILSGPAVSLYRFYKNVYTDEGYLTNTLPVKPVSILASKLITGIVWTIISGVIVALCYCIFVTSSKISLFTVDYDDINNSAYISALFDFISDNIWFIISFMIFGLISVIMSISSVYVSVSIGNLVNRHKVLISLVVYFCLTIVLGMAIGIILVLAGTDIYETNRVFENTETFKLSGEYTVMIWIYSAVLFIISLIELFVTHLIMKHKLNLA